MKKIKPIHSLSCFLLLTISAFSQTKQDTATIKFFQETIIDTVDANNTNLKYYFVFKNTGNEPLIIEYAQGSDPDFPFYYPRMPIKPGEIDSIGVLLWTQQLKIPDLRRQYIVYYNKDKEAKLYLRRRIIK